MLKDKGEKNEKEKKKPFFSFRILFHYFSLFSLFLYAYLFFFSVTPFLSHRRRPVLSL